MPARRPTTDISIRSKNIPSELEINVNILRKHLDGKKVSSENKDRIRDLLFLKQDQSY